jgi:hypothetical protein
MYGLLIDTPHYHSLINPQLISTASTMPGSNLTYPLPRASFEDLPVEMYSEVRFQQRT